ncbi:uncharacterized protein GLRG_11397 [Colletotrichum graminicola M1.001]|uniref:Mid2 domain-containing protein n=1 Tax=Colletotrichum graminicola (strain M1.001 / M2 / FGSC 10212) TaxID=645133 RepID=E3QZG4_COLGM|nr:uncharacterized protein GLRG_11397 [Colletotrichum graminicola M1.001]EFQ36252.1 hypothetical protein GLRG_11397 [Colletotrichum graminicola M1.001]
MSKPPRLILLFICSLFLFTGASQGETCYSYSGLAWPNQKVCEGSSACCGVKDDCMPNRLCKSQDLRDNILVRGPCLSTPWDRSNCAQTCVFNETTINTGFVTDVFPRVEDCGNSTYCCMQGSESCCDSSARKVFLDDNGVLLSAAPSQTTSSSVVSSTEATLTTASSSQTLSTTVTSEPTQDPVDGSDSGANEALALKVGLGVGIPFAAMVVGLATWLITRKLRKKDSNASEQVAPTSYGPDEGHGGYAKGSTYRSSPYVSYRSSSPAGLNEMHEMPGRPDEGWDGTPRELAGSELRGGRNH